MLEIIIFAWLMCFPILLFDLNISLKNIDKNLSKFVQDSVATNHENYTGASSYEEMRQIREDEFDKRILALQMEIDNFNGVADNPRKTNIEAEILAKGIYNIPHDDVNITPLPEFEVAD